MAEITTTLNRIRAHFPCRGGWEKLLAGLGKTKADDEPLPFARIVEINGLGDALWCCRAEPQHAKEWRLFAVWCARQAQHLMTDQRSIAALDVAERYAHGLASDEELAAARDAARAAPAAAWGAQDAARAAPAAARYAAWDAAQAARAATRYAARAAPAAARYAAWDAAQDAAWAAGAAGDAARAAPAATRYAAWDAARDAGDAAWYAARAAQTKKFLEIVGGRAGRLLDGVEHNGLPVIGGGDA